MATPKVSLKLPDPKPYHSPDTHMKMSHRFIRLARMELKQGRRLQASEKAWGATAHATKAIGIHRGWYHRGHGLMYDIVSQVGEEHKRPDFVSKFNAVESHHRNFYNNDKYEADIRRTIDTVEQLVNDFDKVRLSDELPYKVETPDAQTRLKNLTGKSYPIGMESPNGFAVKRRRWRYKGKQGQVPNIQPRQGKQTSGDQSAGNVAEPGRSRRSRKNKKRNGASPEINIRLD